MINKIECNGLLFGCSKCDYVTHDAGKFVQCSVCQDGLYLFANSTNMTSLLPSNFTFCVSDCAKAHHAYVNNPFTG